VYIAIRDAISQCSPLQIQLFHVKGHQDKNPKRKLTLPEQLNVECDCLAKRYAHSATQSSTGFGNPAIPAAQLHLIIEGKLICRNVIPLLRTATSAQPYRRYLKEKFMWTERDLRTINWEVFSSTLKSFQSEDQRRLILFINDKLPLRASKAHPHYGSKLCPSCQWEPETSQHLLTCTNASREEHFRTLKSVLSKWTQEVGLHPCVLTTFWLGLVATRTGMEYPAPLPELPQPLQAPIQTQMRLGWKQLYYGRTAVAWTQAIKTLTPHLMPSGIQVMITLT